jgi:hypothetical protein
MFSVSTVRVGPETKLPHRKNLFSSSLDTSYIFLSRTLSPPLIWPYTRTQHTHMYVCIYIWFTPCDRISENFGEIYSEVEGRAEMLSSHNDTQCAEKFI